MSSERDSFQASKALSRKERRTLYLAIRLTRKCILQQPAPKVPSLLSLQQHSNLLHLCSRCRRRRYFRTKKCNFRSCEIENLFLAPFLGERRCNRKEADSAFGTQEACRHVCEFSPCLGTMPPVLLTISLI